MPIVLSFGVRRPAVALLKLRRMVSSSITKRRQAVALQKLDRSLRLTRDQFDQPSFSLPAKVIIFPNKFTKIGSSSIGTVFALTIALAL